MTTLVYTNFCCQKVFARTTGFLSSFSRNGSNSTSSKLGFIFPPLQLFLFPHHLLVLSFLRPLIAWPISEAAFSNKSAPIFLQLGLYI